MRHPIEIDGSHGEGGGQILRSALSLSLMTGLPFRMSRVRARRAKPGLMRQHLACVLAAQQVSGARVRGAELGSTELEFHPGPLVAGEYAIEIGSAGSTTLVAQSLLPAFIAKGVEARLVIHGGTHNPMAPPFSAIEHVVAPLVRRMGVPVEVTLKRPGFAPMGGGIIEVGVGHRAELGPLVLEERGPLRSVTLEVLTVSLPDEIARREIDVVRARFRAELGDIPIVERHHSPSKNHWQVSSVGNAVAVMLHFAGHTEEVSMLGERRLAAERVAAIVADKALAFLAHGQPVGEHLQDQLPVLLTATGGGRYRTTAPTDHLVSQLDLIPRFTGRPIEVLLDPGDSGSVGVMVPPLDRGALAR